VHFELFWIETPRHIDDAVFHAAGFEGENHVKDFEATFVGHSGVLNKEREKTPKFKLQTSEKIQVQRNNRLHLEQRFDCANICGMPEPVSSAAQEFDRYAKNYDEALAQGISVSGEDKDFFARGRVEWLARCLRNLSFDPKSVLDFGCGTGSAAPHLSDVLRPGLISGIDISEQSVDLARRLHGSQLVNFQALRDFKPNANFDLAFCNGVFHHIPVAERAGAVKCIYDSVKPGGLFAFWENNPWNPGTRYVMSRIPFDRDAIMVSAPEARRLLGAGGFEILRTDFLFIFPRLLSWLRGLEPSVSRLPLGAQYQVLCRKPK
jgi:SAM-dependent methyltransferase